LIKDAERKISSLRSTKRAIEDNVSWAKTSLDKVRYTCDMMHILMLDLLDLAQMEAKSLSINNDFFDLFAVIQKSFAVVRHIADKKNIQLLEPEMTSSQRRNFGRIFGDKMRYM
jgi:signal transduction histidine kinase